MPSQERPTAFLLIATLSTPGRPTIQSLNGLAKTPAWPSALAQTSVAPKHIPGISQWQSTEKPSRGKINYIPHPSVSLWVLQYTCARSPASRRTLPEFRDVTLLLLQQSTHTNFQSSLSPQKHASEALELLKENARMQKLTSDDACTHTPLTSAVYPRCSRKSLPFRRRWRRAAARRPPPSFRHRESPVCSEGVGGELNHFSTAPVFWGGLHEIRVDSFSQQ